LEILEILKIVITLSISLTVQTLRSHWN